MGWQLRNKRWYYYHTININGRYVSKYFGAGEEGRKAEAMFECMAEGRRLAREAKRAAKEAKAPARKRRSRPAVEGGAVRAGA